MKTRKCGIYAALAAVLLISAVLVTNCVDPLNTGGLTVPEKDKPSFVPPPGKAYLIVTVPKGIKEAERTIMPDAVPTLHYKVDIVGTLAVLGEDYDNDDAEGDGDFATNTEFFVLDNDGIYNVTVGAYTVSDFSEPPIAIGQANGVTVTGGVGTVTIPVEKIVNGTTTLGTFRYNLTLPTTTPDTVSLTVTPYAGGGAVYTSTTASGSSNTIPSGYYWVRLTMEKARYVTVTYSHILHVYGNQTSSWGVTGTPIVLPNLNKNSFDVSYNLNYTSGTPAAILDSNPPGNTGWPNGSTVTINAAYASTDPSQSGYVFNGWHTVAAYTSQSSSTKWEFYDAGSPTGTENKIYKDTTLYAGWLAGLVITITPYADPENPVFTFTPSSASFPHADALSGLTISITANLPAGFTALDGSTDGWYYGTSNTPISTTAVLNNAAVSAIDFTVAGSYPFTFKGTKGGLQYSGEFTIVIEAP